MRRLLPLLAIAVLPACGTIEFGDELEDGAFGNGGGGGGGGEGGADAGPADPGCTERTPPPPPARWPYPTTKVAYLAEFWSPLPLNASCGASIACHASGGVAPLIPVTEAQLDGATVLADAIEQIYARVLPDPANPGRPVPLLYEHAAGGGARPPVFSMEQLMFLESFVKRSHDCGWKGQDLTPRAGECPLPNLDLSYCTP